MARALLLGLLSASSSFAQAVPAPLKPADVVHAPAVVSLTFDYAVAAPAVDSVRRESRLALLRVEGPPELPAVVLEGAPEAGGRAVLIQGIERTERVHFALEDGAFVRPAAGIVVFNFYYAKPGEATAVLAQRLHASDVRERLGRPRGSVLRRLDGDAGLPDVLWRCAYPDAAARAADAAALDASPEWKPVPELMETLLRHFARATYAVATP